MHLKEAERRKSKKSTADVESDKKTLSSTKVVVAREQKARKRRDDIHKIARVVLKSVFCHMQKVV
jgi:hypothetical protein